MSGVSGEQASAGYKPERAAQFDILNPRSLEEAKNSIKILHRELLALKKPTESPPEKKEDGATVRSLKRQVQSYEKELEEAKIIASRILQNIKGE